MCHYHHTTTTIRTRLIKRVSHESYSHGTGQLRTIQHVKALTQTLYQGHLPNGTPYTLTRAQILAKPKMYRLRKERGHRNCYQLVITQEEVYRQLEGVKPACGPMQMDLRRGAKRRFYLCNGKNVTDLALRERKNLDEFEVVWLKGRDGKGRQYLRETSTNGVTETDVGEGNDTD